MGTLIPSEPDYALFMKAAQIIQKTLDSVSSDESFIHPVAATVLSARQTYDETLPTCEPDMWSFDFSLWDNLSDYPGLQGVVSG